MSQLSKFDESEAKLGRAGRDMLIAVLLVALAVIIAAAAIFIGREGSNDVAPVVVEAPAVPFDYDEAAELSALRWQEMARFYEKNGLLLDDAVDSSLSTTAPGWEQARAYEYNAALAKENDLLSDDAVDSSLSTTAPGWEQARAYEYNAALAAGMFLPEGITVEESLALFDAESSGNEAGSTADYDAFYTERYWKMAAEAESRREALPEVPDGVPFQPQ